jgi:glycosyltransferase involved in cell wall biosynthesis
MLKILINAYACSPNMGSEPGMAWNWCVNLANHCELHIITEGEFKEQIEAVLPTLPQGKKMHFYYNPVSEDIRKMCWNQGDWRFYKHYEKWQQTTYEMAKDIIARENIDIIHQLNMIGFREPGYLWRIKDIPFVWGPIGGLKKFPAQYLKGSGIRNILFNRLKNWINILQLRFHPRVDQAMNKASLLISSIPDSYYAIKKYKKKESIIIPETGCYITHESPSKKIEHKALRAVWVGKFDFRKQLSLALKAISQTKNKEIYLDIYGTGSEGQQKEAQELASRLGINHRIVWHGQQSNVLIKEAMLKADLFLFTSVSEDTSTVVLEAISNRLPVLCFDACGFGAVIDETVGQKIPLTHPEQSVKDFAERLDYFYIHREKLEELSKNCESKQIELSWEKKIEKALDLYKKLLKN